MIGDARNRGAGWTGLRTFRSFENDLRDLFQEQRDAVGARDDFIEDIGRQLSVGTRELPDQCCAFASSQALQIQHRHM